MVARFHETQDTMTRTKVELVREGKYAAEVSVELIEEEGGWSPYLSLDDARKLDSVRLALRQGDIVDASKYVRVFELPDGPSEIVASGLARRHRQGPTQLRRAPVLGDGGQRETEAPGRKVQCPHL